MRRIAFIITAILLTAKTSIYAAAPIGGLAITETPISVKTLSGTISGTLAMPAGVSGKVPVVLIIGDSGAIDRDGNNPKTGLSANTYKILAEELGKKGVATVRYDKRMV